MGAQIRAVHAMTNVWQGVVPSALTAAALAALSHLGLVGDLPLWFLLAMLAAAVGVAEVTGRFAERDPSTLRLQGALAAQVGCVTAIIYAIGWGPTLTVGYVFVLVRALENGGARVWRATFAWTLVGVSCGQVAIG